MGIADTPSRKSPLEVMTDQQDLRKIRETLNEMIADGEVTAKDRSDDGRGPLPSSISARLRRGV